MKLIYYSLQILFFLSLFYKYVYSLGQTPLNIPNPMENPVACGRPGVPRSQICDPDNMLAKENKDVIEGYINAIKKAEIAVAVVSSMSSELIKIDSIETASEKFARQLVLFIFSLNNCLHLISP